MMKSVKSSHIHSVGYDPQNRMLLVRFKDGTGYRYQNVEPETHADFMKSESKGRFFASRIRGIYPHAKAGPDDMSA